MTEAVQVTDYVANGLRKLPVELQGKPKIAGMLKAWLEGVQSLEDAVFGIRSMMELANAVGVWLDRLGRIVNQPRLGFDDDTYRVWIGARILINRSSGTPPQLIGIVAALVPDGVMVDLEEQYPAGLTIHTYGELPNVVGSAIGTILQRAKCPGVRLLFHYELPGTAFRFSASDAVESGVAYGYDNGLATAITEGRAVVTAAGAPDYVPSLDFSDSRNSQNLVII